MEKQEKQKIDVVFLLDKSLSMKGCEEATIKGYNDYLKEQKKKDSLITTVLFNDKYELLHFRENVKNVKKLNKKSYNVDGCTALYDAIGKTIKKLDKKVKDNKVLFIITTDGLENASTDYNKDKISKLIKSHKNYEFIYIGASIDSYVEGSKLGIPKKNIANYSKDKKGIGNLFKCACYLSECMAFDKEIANNWKKELESDW